MEISIQVEGFEYRAEVQAHPREENVYLITVDGRKHTVRMIEPKPESYTISIDDWVGFFEMKRDRYGMPEAVVTENKVYQVRAVTPRQLEMERLLSRFAKEAGLGTGGEVRAPMPGKILKVLVEPGQEVKPDSPVAILEAMKMENEIIAEVEGVVREVKVKAGDTVENGQLLVVVGPQEE